MIVVSDTGPLNYLVLLGVQDVLPAIYGNVLIPPAVVRELLHDGTPAPVRDWIRHPPHWLETRSPATIHPRVNLGRGESEALSLAIETHAQLILIDEKKGRLLARDLGIQTSGTLGVLDAAAQRGLIDLSDTLKRLIATSFRTSPSLIHELLKRDSQRRHA